MIHKYICTFTHYTLILIAVIMWHFFQQWLNEEKLAQRLIELIHPERDEEVEGHSSIFISMSNSFLWLNILPLALKNSWIDDFAGLNIHVCVCVFSLTEAVQCISDFVRHHSPEQRPGQSAARDFTAWPFADCAGVVSQTDTHTLTHTHVLS